MRAIAPARLTSSLESRAWRPRVTSCVADRNELDNHSSFACRVSRCSVFAPDDGEQVGSYDRLAS
jgi:hypothetical protein